MRATALQHLVVGVCPHRYNSVYPSVSHQTIIVLDFGSQYTQLIARRLRELSVYSEIWPPDTPAEKIRARAPVGIILSGGPKSVSDAGAPRCDPALFDMGRPVLGICYGMQLMADTLGGVVAPAPHREFGHATVSISGRGDTVPAAGAATAGPRALFADVPAEIRVWASHGDFVAAAPAGFSRGRHQRQRAGRRDGGRRSPALRAAVSSRGRAHRARSRDPAQFRVRRLRLHRRLDDGVVCRGGDGADSRAGRAAAASSAR